jgi:DNA-binding LacI/PurR family transcriptional regulator
MENVFHSWFNPTSAQADSFFNITGWFMVSIVDVANLANVSVTTVSRVLSGSSHPVSEETRERVLEAARSLDYFPNALAQAMVTRATHIVGVIIGDALDPYFAAIVRGVEDVAREQGYLVIVCNSDRLPDIELQYLQTLSSYRVDGVIFAGGGLIDAEYNKNIERALEAFYKRGSACVALAQHLFPSMTVLVDNKQVVHDAVSYLVELGHKKIAYISGPQLLTTAKLRLDGYESALMRRDLELKPGYILEGDYTYESGLEAARAIAALPVKPTAVMASNDLMAIGCLVGLKELGYRIPEDVSIVGADDIATAQVVDPPLTTVSLPLYDLGAIGMGCICKLRNGQLTIDDVITLPHHLVIRKSTSAPGS